MSATLWKDEHRTKDDVVAVGPEACKVQRGMHYEVRRYVIEAGKLDEFAAVWRSGVVPLRESFGFRFHGAWVLETSSEFVWVISHDNSDSFDQANRAYYESEERERLSPDPARYIVRINEAAARTAL